jgi:hypothetical protein
VVSIPAHQSGIVGAFKQKLQPRGFDVAIAKGHVYFVLMPFGGSLDAGIPRAMRPYRLMMQTTGKERPSGQAISQSHHIAGGRHF